ncbi:MAG: FHA domain-containing protein [Thermosynechococcaceae cyanobacterium]
MRLHQENYSIGRDKQSDIVLFSKTVSRCHARLIQLSGSHPLTISYQILDGDGTGKTSTNGITVNGEACRVHDLQEGDRVSIGNVQLSYCIESPTPAQDVQQSAAANLQQVKDLAPLLNPKSTLIDQMLPDDLPPGERPEEREDDLPATTLFRQP